MTTPNIPEEVTVTYRTPTHGGGYWEDASEGLVRSIAASKLANGSGHIERKTITRNRSRDGSTLTVLIKEVYEELSPVTEFDSLGQSSNDAWNLLQDCNHEDVGKWYLVYSAGHQKDYERACLKCGKAVDWK